MADKPLFQEEEEICFDVILNQYGQDCTWEKDGGDVTDLVLFNDPTAERRFAMIAGRGLNHVGYDNAEIVVPSIEYLEGQFDGLFDLVYNQDLNQYITTGGKRYVATKSSSLFDGQTYIIGLQPATDEAVIEQ